MEERGKGEEEVVKYTTSSSIAMTNREACFRNRRENGELLWFLALAKLRTVSIRLKFTNKNLNPNLNGFGPNPLLFCKTIPKLLKINTNNLNI